MNKSNAFAYYQKETLFDLSFSIGFEWHKLAEGARDYIMESIGGSRGLAELAMVWAEEFNKMFAVKTAADPYCCSYMEDVDTFFLKKWGEFIAGHVADRMTKGVVK